jgi:uncharacterized repeat protein (TIGR01451 family)
MAAESHITIRNRAVFALLLCVTLALIGTSSALAVTYVTAPGVLSTAGETYVLNADITASGTAFTIAANNITLDGQQHKIIYATGGSGYGVLLSNRSGVTIKNCVIELPATAAGGGKHAIYGNTSSNCTVTGNNINLDKGTASDNTGIALSYGTFVVSNNTIRVRPVGKGIDVGQTGATQVYGNTITMTPNVGGTHTAGIYVSCPNASAPGGFNVYGNTITVQGGTGTLRNHGIWLAVWAVNGQVHDNQITNNSDESRGIMIDLNSNGSRIYRNTILTTGTNCRGIRLRDSDWDELYENNVHTTGAGGNAIEIGRNDQVNADSCAYNTIHNNTFQADGASTSAISMYDDPENNTFYDDVLISNYCGLNIVNSKSNSFTRERFQPGTNPSSYRDVYITGATGYGISVPSTGNVLTDAIKGSAIAYVWGGGTWDLTVRYSATITVTNSQGAALQGGGVSITDATGANIYMGTTDSNGQVIVPLVNFVQSGPSSRVTKTPHVVTASKAGYTTQQVTVTADHTQSVPIMLSGGDQPTLTITPNNTTPSPGDTVTYTIAYANQTGSQIINCVVTTIVPAHTTFVAGSAGTGVYNAQARTQTWSVGTLPTGQQGQVSFRVTVD